MAGTNFSDNSIANGGKIDTYLANPSGHTILARCTVANLPSGAANYAVGCIIQATDTGANYVNTGSTSSCTFTVLDTALGGAATSLVDSNGLNVVTTGAATTAVNNLKVTNSATGTPVLAAAIGTDTNIGLKVDAKGSGTIILGGTSTGYVSIGRGSLSSPLTSSTIASLGTTQNSTPTAAQLLGGVVTQTGATGAGTFTLPSGTSMSTAVPGVAVGDTFECTFANLGGGQTITITGATGTTVIGNGAVPTAKNGFMTFVNTGTNTWNIYTDISA